MWLRRAIGLALAVGAVRLLVGPMRREAPGRPREARRLLGWLGL